MQIPKEWQLMTADSSVDRAALAGQAASARRCAWPRAAGRSSPTSGRSRTTPASRHPPAVTSLTHRPVYFLSEYLECYKKYVYTEGRDNDFTGGARRAGAGQDPEREWCGQPWAVESFRRRLGHFIGDSLF
jgi:hypothetical protein